MNLDNYVIYLYGKDSSSLEKQNYFLKNYCKEHSITPLKMYVDFGCSNFLKNKKSLNRLLEENKNLNILVYSQDRLSRKTEDLFTIKNICSEKEINFFDISQEKEIFGKDSLYKILDKNMEALLNDFR